MKLIKRIWIILRILFGLDITKKQAVSIFNKAANLIASGEERFMCLAIYEVSGYRIGNKITSVYLEKYGFTGINFANYIKLHFPELALFLSYDFSCEVNAWIRFDSITYASVMEAKVQFLRHLAEINSK